MADTENARREQTLIAQPVESEGQAEHCPNCKEMYCWVFGEDSMPTSLSCGHTICLRCAKNQWCHTGSEESTVLCVTCSAHVAVTSYKPAPTARPETTPTSSGKAAVECEAAVDGHSASEVPEPVQETPSHLPSSAEVIQQHSSEGKQNSSVGYAMDRITSALSSPLVLDKIQSQDDAWRLLQHDEGFIRDWIVANVPDHVIFKMVGTGTGTSDSSLDSSSFVLSNGNTVVISSPPKTEDVAMTVPESAATSFSGESAGQGENLSRSSFEQQFLQYLVSKAAPQDKAASAVDERRGPRLPGLLTTVDSAAQTGLDTGVEENRGISSENKAEAIEMRKQNLKHMQLGRVGNKGDCRVPHNGKNRSRLPNGMVEVSGEGQASQLSATDLQSRAVQSDFCCQNTVADADQYNYGPDPKQSVSAFQAPVSVGSSFLPSADMTYQTSSSPSLYQPNYHPQMFSSANRNGARLPSYPAQRNFQLPESGAFSGSCGPYGSYPFPYAQHPHYSWYGQYGQPYARVPPTFQPGPFQRFPQYVPHRGRGIGKERGTAFPPSSFRTPSESSWSSKACGTALNPPPPSTSSAPPQIRFVQVVRPRSEAVELSRVEEDAATASVRIDEETMENEVSAVEPQEETEAEVALMKTRDMPHGTQVEDIYVVPQVWLSSGQGPVATEPSQKSGCPACPYPADLADSPLSSSDHSALPMSAVDQGVVNPPSSRLSPGKLAVAERYDSEPSSNVIVPGFAGTKVSLPNAEQVHEVSDTPEVSDVGTACLPERAQEKNITEDCSDYTGFKPVAVVTTISVHKPETSSEPKAETTAPDTADLPPPSLIHSSTMTAAPLVSDSGISVGTHSTETPVRDTAITTDDVHREGSIGQVPSAPVKKLDGHFEWKHSTHDASFGPGAAKCSQKRVDFSALTLTSATLNGGPSNKTVHDPLASELTTQVEADTQTIASVNEVEVVEGRSSLPSAIMFPKQNGTGVTQSRRPRRNLSSEFYNSDMEIKGTYHADGQLTERRSYGRNGRWYPSKYSQYGSAFRNSQRFPYPYDYPFSYGPRSYYHNHLANIQNTALDYKHPHSYQQYFSVPNAEKPRDYPYRMPAGDVSAPRQAGTMYPLHHGAAAHMPVYPSFRPQSQYSVPVSHAFPSSLPHSYPDVLGYISSGRGDYSNTSSVCPSPKTQQDYQQDSALGLKTDGVSNSEDDTSGGGVRRLRFWPDKGDSAGDGSAGKSVSFHHRIPPQDLDTVHWIQQEVGELNKEIDSSVLMRLEGCLALLERNAHHHNNDPLAVPGGSGWEVRDMDHLWRCILTLGKVVVQYGWWCRPHRWDGSSERWAEMAMLASSVFTHSMHSLTQVITFYLDHVCTAGDGVGAQEEVFDRAAAEVSAIGDSQTLVCPPTSFDSAYTEYQRRASSNGQSGYTGSMFPKSQSQGLRTAVGQSGSYGTAVENSQPHVSGYVEAHCFSSAKCLENPIRTVVADLPETYVPHPSVFSQYGDDSPAILQSEMYSSDAGHSQEDQISVVSREQEAAPSVVYHYVSSIPDDTQHSRCSGNNTNISPISSSRAPVWTAGRMEHCGEGSGAASTEQPAEPSSVSDCVHTQKPSLVAMSSPSAEQTEMEVYYTVEGPLIDEITSDFHIITAAQASCSSEEKVCAENIVYAVSHLAGDDHSGELCADTTTVSYILSTDADEPPQQPETQDDVPVKTALADVAEDACFAADPPSPDDIRQSTICDSDVKSSGHPIHLDTVPHSEDNKTDTQCGVGTEASMSEAKTVFHSDQSDINLFTVTVLAEQAENEDGVCPGQEVISDTAIMLSETVEVETDGTMEVKGVKDAGSGSHTSLAEESSSPKPKGNLDSSSCSGKRKRNRTPQSKNKYLKQDLSCEKTAKGTSSVKSGKWNLRSSKASAAVVLHSPTVLK